MITPTEAINKVKKKEPGISVTGMADYSAKYYLVSGTMTPKDPDYSGNYYAVNKRTGDVSYYTPGADFDNFFYAINNRRIEI